MNHIVIGVNYALMLFLPVVVALLIRRRTAAPWRFFFIGAATFVLSQVLHIPFNFLVQRSGVLPDDTTTWANLLIIAGFLGLSAGVFEEGARYLTYRYWAKDARSWSRGLMLGAGHGGIEAILVGALAAINWVALLVTVSNPTMMNAIPAEQQSLITDALATIVTTPWYGLMLGALERLFAIVAHLAMSILVLQVFLRRSIIWLFLAIGYHMVLNMVAVIGLNRVGPYATEGLIGLVALFGLWIIFRLSTPEPAAAELEPLPPPPSAESLDLKPTSDALDRSRYQ